MQGFTYFKYRDYLLQRYGAILHRIPLDFGFGCPNRVIADGAHSPEELHNLESWREERSSKPAPLVGGCTFCPVDGSRAQQIANAKTIEEQLVRAEEFARSRYGATQFMAYIQAYTATFRTLSAQKELLARVLSSNDFRAISIGTRPDCLSNKTIEYLRELNQRLDVIVELGVQTTHDFSLAHIKRGHDWQCSREAIMRLSEAGLQVIVHVILGLPGETREHFMQTARRIGELPISGIKLHNLHVVRDTELAAQYAEQPFRLLGEYEYAEVVLEFLRYIPADVAVVRLHTDSPESELIAPRWSIGKQEFLDMVERLIYLRGVCQGDLSRGDFSRSKMGVTGSDVIQGVMPGALSVGMSERMSDVAFGQIRHQSGMALAMRTAVAREFVLTPFLGDRQRSNLNFVGPSGLRDMLLEGAVRILDIGFGLGNNTLAALHVAQELSMGHRLSVHALEIDRRNAMRYLEDGRGRGAKPFDQERCSEDGERHQLLAGLLSNRVRVEDSSDGRCLGDKCELGECQDGDCVVSECRIRKSRITVIWGDARQTILSLDRSLEFDLVFLDPYSPVRNCELWTVDFFKCIARRLSPRGRVYTYGVPLPVIAGMVEAGFIVGEFEHPRSLAGDRVGGYSTGVMAALHVDHLRGDLSAKKIQMITTTTHGVPYRDPHLLATHRSILEQRANCVAEFKERLRG